MRKILNQCPKQKYLVEIESEKKFIIRDKAISKISDFLFEISVDLENSLSNSIKSILSNGGKIINIQPKNNRLEELFLNLTE